MKLIQPYIVYIILNCWNLLRIILIIFTDGSKDGDKTAAAFIYQCFEFSKHLPDKASIFTAELEAIVSALRSIKSTT